MRENVLVAIANPYKPYILQVDASGYAEGAVLSQLDAEGKERPIAFFSQKLQENRGWDNGAGLSASKRPVSMFWPF